LKPVQIHPIAAQQQRNMFYFDALTEHLLHDLAFRHDHFKLLDAGALGSSDGGNVS